MWHDRTRRGRADQAIKVGEPGVVVGITANSVATGCRGRRQDGQAAETKSLMRDCSQTWTRAWSQRGLAFD